MLTEDERYVFKKRQVVEMLDVKKKASKGIPYSCELSSVNLIRIQLEVCDSTMATVVENERIFEGIFE